MIITAEHDNIYVFRTFILCLFFLKYYFCYFLFFGGGELHGQNEHLQFQLVSRSDVKIDILIQILPHPNLMDIIMP